MKKRVREHKGSKIKDTFPPTDFFAPDNMELDAELCPPSRRRVKPYGELRSKRRL